MKAEERLQIKKLYVNINTFLLPLALVIQPVVLSPQVQ